MDNFEKLKKSTKEYLNGLNGFEFEKEKFIDDDILRNICKITSENDLEIALVVNRKGKILSVSVGQKNSAEIALNNSEYLSHERVIHTHPNGDSTLSNMDLSLLKNNRCDCVCAIGVKNGEPYDAHVAYFDGKSVFDKFVHDARFINKFGLMDLILEYDKMIRENLDVFLNKEIKERAILVMVEFMKNQNTILSLDELEGLAETDKIEVVGRLTQKREKPDSKYYIGQGKLDELRNKIQLSNANLVIFENELNGSKLTNLENALGVRVIDRSMLILDIFAGRAKTNEGKLQVKLAQLKYSLPRLSSLNISDNKFGGGAGMRGPGETKLELNRRIVENNIIKLSKELNELKKKRALNRNARTKNSKPVVSIVGYTNSGKSSLLNLLAKSDAYVQNELFATLDTTSRNVWLGDRKEIVVTDTVGFINNLPHEFIEAFGSTLEECVYSDLLLHVVDVSNPNYIEHIKVTNDVLKKIGCKAPVLMVFNKIDKGALWSVPDNVKNWVEISVVKQKNINILKDKIIELLNI